MLHERCKKASQNLLRIPFPNDTLLAKNIEQKVSKNNQTIQNC